MFNLTRHLLIQAILTVHIFRLIELGITRPHIPGYSEIGLFLISAFYMKYSNLQGKIYENSLYETKSMHKIKI